MSRAGFYGFLILVLCLSCIKKTITNKSSNNLEIDLENYSEDLSVYRPNYKKVDSVAIVKVEKRETKGNPVVELIKISQNREVEEVLNKISVSNKNINESKGFRLQVFVGNTKEGFLAAKSYLMNHYPELEIYESYSQPTYKIKAGDFLDRLEAEKYYASLKSKFSGTRVIVDRINIKKGLKLN